MKDNTEKIEKEVRKSFFKRVKSEFKKVVWPDKDTIIKKTTAVVVITVVVGILISLLDSIIKLGVDKILMLG